MDESTDPARRNGGTHQVGKTHQTPPRRHAGGKHQAGKTGQADPKPEPGKHAAGPREAMAPGVSPRKTGSRSGVLALSRRNLLISGGALAAAVAGLEGLRKLATPPVRLAVDPANADIAGMPGHMDLPDIQFNIGNFTAPAVTVNGVLVAFPPVFTLFATATLERRPSREDQRELARALNEIERAYQFSPQGVFAFVAYGLPYFNRFSSKLFGAKVPRLLSGETRFALEEAVPSPTDVSAANPGITKKTFNVPVMIEANDLLFTLRSDHVGNLWDVLAFLGGSNKLAGHRVRSPHLHAGLKFTSTRVMFVQRGLPRQVADQNKLVFAPFVNPNSPMWLGFADQQTNATAPAPDVTFAGADGIHFTTAQPGEYFDNGALQHLAHDILDMAQWFDLNAADMPGADGTFLEHVQYMFRANPPPALGRVNQFLNGGGAAFLPNEFKGAGDAARSAAGIGTRAEVAGGPTQHRMGHISTLQRSSRTADGRPIHVRNDGPGFDSMDVPDGSKQPKLQFMVFVPSADFFARMRSNQASLDLQAKFHVSPTDNGLERFITATRRQNFLIPPRRHRAFPFAEFEHDAHPAAAAKSSPAKKSPAKKSSPATSSPAASGGSGGGGGTGGGGAGGGGGTGGGGGGTGGR